MDDSELRNIASHIVSGGFEKLIKKLYDTGEIEELVQYLPENSRDEKEQYKWNIEKAKIVLEILKLRGNDVLENILTYAKQSEYGWQEDTYHLYNRCLLYGHHCREHYEVENSPEITERVFANTGYLFLHPKYGAIALYLFCYSLAALFSSILKKDHLT